MSYVDNRYERYLRIKRNIAQLNTARNLLDWDRAVGLMPTAGAEYRAETIGYLDGLAHGMATSNELRDALAELMDDADDGNLGPVRSELLRKEWRTYARAKRLPKEFVERLSVTQATSVARWEAGRVGGDWDGFMAQFAELVTLCREKAAMLVEYGHEPYDALLQDWEAGMTSVRLDGIFAVLRPRLMRLTQLIDQAPLSIVDLPTFDCDAASKTRLAEQIADAFGFDRAAGRADASEHPFSVHMQPGDVRYTVERRSHGLLSFTGSVAHELGHCLSMQGLPTDLYGTCFYDDPTYGFGEGIARAYENRVARSLPFMEWLLSRIPRMPKAIDLYRAYNAVRPGSVRMYADEVHYDLHVLQRFIIGRTLINGSLLPQEVPDAWNALSRELLSIDPADDALSDWRQDVHWFEGAFGSFEGSTLGNVWGAQLHAAAARDMPGLVHGYGKGEFLGLRDWFRTKVFVHGARYSPDELLQLVTGEATDPRHYLDALERRYYELYQL